MHHDTRLTTATRSSRTALVCLALIAAVLVIYTIVNVFVRPVIWSDSGWGLLWWFARHGLPFNFTYVPSRDDIAEDTPMFMAEWSPGQHVLPALLESWGLDLGQAVIVVVASFSTLGLWGWYALYRAFGFSQSTSSVTLVLVALTRHFAAPFGIYVGGEVLIFGVAPWFLLLVWRLRDLAPVAIVPLVAGTAVMFFAKLSGMIVACAAIVAAVLCTGEGPFTGRVIHRGLVAGATIALIGVIFYFAWYSRGWTAASTFGGFSWVELLSAIVFVMGSTWSAALSFGDLGNLIFVHPGRQIFSSSVPITCVFAPLAILTALFLWKQLRNRYAEYLRFCFYTAAAYGVVMVLVWSNGAPIGLEERYFRTTSMLFLVGAVQCFFDLPSRLARGLALATVALSSAYGFASQAVHVRRNLAYPMSARGFKHSTASQAVIDFLPTIDVLHPDARSTLIYVPSPEIGLDVRRVRVMAIHADVILPEHLARIVYRGRVPRLYLIVQQNLIENGKAELLLRSFADYSPDRWLKKSLGGFTCFYVVE